MKVGRFFLSKKIGYKIVVNLDVHGKHCQAYVDDEKYSTHKEQYNIYLSD